jgi:low affinity Fe/Cu permease
MSHTHSKPPLFSRVSNWVAKHAGRPETFLIACATVVVWLATGPVFDFNETWQLVINTATTIVTFLMVFVIQDSQNRDATALHLKLDELIRATDAAQNDLIDLADMSQQELDRLVAEYSRIAHEPQQSRIARSVRAEHQRRTRPTRQVPGQLLTDPMRTER